MHKRKVSIAKLHEWQMPNAQNTQKQVPNTRMPNAKCQMHKMHESKYTSLPVSSIHMHVMHFNTHQVSGMGGGAGEVDEERRWVRLTVVLSQPLDRLCDNEVVHPRALGVALCNAVGTVVSEVVARQLKGVVLVFLFWFVCFVWLVVSL